MSLIFEVTFFIVSSPSSYIFFIMFMSEAPGSSSADFSPGAGFSPDSLLQMPERLGHSSGGSDALKPRHSLKQHAFWRSPVSFARRVMVILFETFSDRIPISAFKVQAA